MSNYIANAASDAAETVLNYEDEILEQLLDAGEASDDLLNDYPNGDAWHHESHVDRDYNLQEAALLLGELRDYEETDSGLWQAVNRGEPLLQWLLTLMGTRSTQRGVTLSRESMSRSPILSATWTLRRRLRRQL